MTYRNQFVILLSLALIPSYSLGVSEVLETFARDPLAASRLRPLKEGIATTPRFSDKEIQRRDFVAIKAKERQRILCRNSQIMGSCPADFEPQEAYNEEWQIRYFVGGPIDKNIFNLAQWAKGNADKIPWPGYYWPLYMGGIGNRYADPQFPQQVNFKTNYDYYRRHMMKLPTTAGASLDHFAPSEKYDLLINDSQWSLTRASWEDSKYYYDRSGKVETWMGLCHGWAPAAIAVPEPIKVVNVSLPDHANENLAFFPDDLKALTSALWANGRFNVEFVGGRCDRKDPKRDENGRLVDPECFDLNPSAWHLALTHQLGKNRQSFVIDATYDYEVWNQPIYSYKLSYFNPQNQQPGELTNSIVAYANVTKDPFRKYRSPKVAYLIGVVSEIQYVVENQPSSNPNQIPDPYEYLVSVAYHYDLELDENHQIIGGEWYQQEHPDMLWRASNGATAQHPQEAAMSDWNGNFPLPQPLATLAPSASSKDKMPLAKILNYLIGGAH